jgi:hypothetical protein
MPTRETHYAKTADGVHIAHPSLTMMSGVSVLARGKLVQAPFLFDLSGGAHARDAVPHGEVQTDEAPTSLSREAIGT